MSYDFCVSLEMAIERLFFLCVCVPVYPVAYKDARLWGGGATSC